MKQFISTILTSALLLNGCTSFKPLEVEDRAQGRPKPDERVLIVLDDGSEIETSTWVQVSDPSDFIFGTGRLFRPGARQAESFTGKISRSVIDSCKTATDQPKTPLPCWLSDGNRVVFEGGSYVTVSSDSGTGFWCTGTLESKGEKSDFSGRVPYERIKEIEVRKFSTGKTVLGVLYFAAFVAILDAVLAIDVSFDFGGMGSGSWGY